MSVSTMMWRRATSTGLSKSRRRSRKVLTTPPVRAIRIVRMSRLRTSLIPLTQKFVRSPVMASNNGLTCDCASESIRGSARAICLIIPLAAWLFELVPNPAHRLDIERVAGIGFDFFADRVDVDIQAMFLLETIFAPESGEQVAAREDPSRILGQAVQDRELHHGQMNGPALDGDDMPGRIDLQFADSHKAGGRCLAGFASEDCPDARHQFPRAERFNHVIVRSEFQPGHTVFFLTLGGHHDDRNEPCLLEHSHHLLGGG